MSEVTPANAARFVLNETDHTFARDPYPGFRVLREHAPVCRQPDGSLLLTRYAELRRIFEADDITDDITPCKMARNLMHIMVSETMATSTAKCCVTI